MKQHITVEQLKVLPFEVYDKLHIICEMKDGIKEVLARRCNIGKMIEILEERHGKIGIDPVNSLHYGYSIIAPYPNKQQAFEPKELSQISCRLDEPICENIKENALCDALGITINSLPLTPEKVLKAMKEKNNK